jgi:hypothetical protein
MAHDVVASAVLDADRYPARLAGCQG